MRDIIRTDIDDVFFTDFAETVTYERNGKVHQVQAVFGEQKLDEEEAIDVEARTEIFLKQKELDDLGLGGPPPHDLIAEEWKVEARELNDGVWKLSCYKSVRPRP